MFRSVLVLFVVMSAVALAAAPTMSNLNPSTRPSARTGTALVTGVALDGGELEILFGGNSLLGTNNQTWTYGFSPNTWVQKSSAGAPSARAWHSMTWDSQNARAILFGGSADLNGPLRQDTWAYDPLSDTWAQLTNAGSVPSVRFSAALVYVPDQGRHLLFGGGTATSSTAAATAVDNGLWWLSVDRDAGVATWSAIDAGGIVPAARASPCAAYDPVRHRLIVFGGEIVNDSLSDTAEFDLASNAWLAFPDAGGVKRGSTACVYDARTDKVVLYGGTSSPTGSPLGTAFEYLPGNHVWRNIAPTPNAGSLSTAAPAFSPRLGGMVFFGGRTGAIQTSQATWTLLVNAAPLVSLPAMLTFDEGVSATLPATFFDADNDSPSWGWRQDAGPSVVLSSTMVGQPTFTTPVVTSQQVLRFTVSASDGIEAASAVSDVIVRDNVNEPPVVDAGPDQSVAPGAPVQLSGSASDPNGEVLTFAWVQRAGSAVSLTNDALEPSFVAPSSGEVLTFEFSASDTRGGTTSDTVSVTVAGNLDGGPGEVDAGGSGSDAGDRAPVRLSAGCGCGSGRGAPWWVLALWGLARFRARRGLSG